VPSARRVRDPEKPLVALKVDAVRAPVSLLKVRREDPAGAPPSLNIT